MFSINGKSCSPFSIPELVDWDVTDNVLTTNWISNTPWDCSYNMVLQISCASSGTVLATVQSECITKSSVDPVAYDEPFVISLDTVLDICYETTLEFRAKEADCGTDLGGSAWTTSTSFEYEGFESFYILPLENPVEIFEGESVLIGVVPYNACSSPSYSWTGTTASSPTIVVTPSADWTYTVTSSSEDDCVSFWDEVEISVLVYPITSAGLNEGIENEGVQVFPNPFDEQFTLEFPEEHPGAQAIVFDPMGRAVFSTFLAADEPQLIIRDLEHSSDIFFVKVTFKNGVTVWKKVLSF